MSEKQFFFNTTFENGESLISFLEKENNNYSKFILAKLLEKSENISNSEDLSNKQKHHIQPKHAGGPDFAWNLIYLSISDHALAHQLLYDCYGNFYDLCAYHMIYGQTKEAFKNLRQQNQIRMKEEKVGFYNSEFQRELGSRKKNRPPKARNFFVKTAFEKGFALQNIETKDLIIFKPFECETMRQVIDKWVAHPSLKNQQEKWLKCKKKESFYLYTALVRSMTGHISKKDNKRVYTIAGWRILGIFLELELD